VILKKVSTKKLWVEDSLSSEDESTKRRLIDSKEYEIDSKEDELT